MQKSSYLCSVLREVLVDMVKFNDIINGDKLVLVDFFATWCHPCKMMEPILKEVAKELEDKVRVLKIDVDKNIDVADFYGIRSIPTLILFKSGQAVWRHSGYIDKKAILIKVRLYI